MTAGDDKELIAFCAGILTDDEITEGEAYALAEWLNDHPAATRSWPGVELIGPLKEIWMDGVVSTRELQRLARLLGGLEREWVRRSTPAKTHRKVELVDFARALGTTPRLPRIAVNVEIPSWEEADSCYRVDLRGPSCSCSEWCRWRSYLPDGHLGRCCKHIFDAYTQLPRGHAGAAWLIAFLDLGRPSHSQTKWKLLNSDSEPVLISSANKKGWADVFAKDGSEYQRYGYNVEERRWSYRSEPESAEVIADEIVALGETSARHSHQAQKRNRQARPSRNASMCFVSRVLGLGGLAAALAFGFVTLKSRIDPGLSTISRGNAATVVPRSTTRTLRNVRIMTEGHEAVIPQGTELRVIARTPADVMVSFGGDAVTIPVSETDLK